MTLNASKIKGSRVSTTIVLVRKEQHPAMASVSRDVAPIRIARVARNVGQLIINATAQMTMNVMANASTGLVVRVLHGPRITHVGRLKNVKNRVACLVLGLPINANVKTERLKMMLASVVHQNSNRVEENVYPRTVVVPMQIAKKRKSKETLI